jgi:hypothetical protein
VQERFSSSIAYDKYAFRKMDCNAVRHMAV